MCVHFLGIKLRVSQKPGRCWPQNHIPALLVWLRASSEALIPSKPKPPHFSNVPHLTSTVMAESILGKPDKQICLTWEFDFMG